MKPDANRPPLYTVWEEILHWTLDRTAGLPKSQRFTFGQRIDTLSMDVMLGIVEAIYTREKLGILRQLNLWLEQLRVLWRLVQKREWISRKQLIYIQARIDEAGRMLGGWAKRQKGGAP
jgi:hypothetical protein